MSRKFQLFGGPLCGISVVYVKPEIRIKLRAGADPLVARYRFAVNGYYYENTREVSEVPPNKEADVKTAEFIAADTPPSWGSHAMDTKEYRGTPWPQWFTWQLKH